MAIIFGDDGIVLEGLVVFGIRCLHGAVHAVAPRETHPEVLCIVEFAVAPALGALHRARPNADEVNRTVADIVIGVSKEILRR